MEPATPPPWLPAGWKAHYKVRKSGRKVLYYTNEKSEEKFYCKKDVIHLAKIGKIRYNKSQALEKCVIRGSKGKKMDLVLNESSQCLPKGWTVELRTRQTGKRVGKGYKCYIEPVNGFKFYSMLEVSRYLKTVNCRNSTVKRTEGNDLHSCHNNCEVSSKPEAPIYIRTKHNNCKSKRRKIRGKVVVEKVEAVGFPPGWMKEIKTRKTPRGFRKDSFYTDPATGCIFRSKIDALRYLETGKMSKHVIIPKKRLVDYEESIEVGISPPSITKRHKLMQDSAKEPTLRGYEKQGKRASAVMDSVSNHTGVNPQEMRDAMAKISAKTKEACEMIGSAMEEATISNRGKTNFDENGPVLTPGANGVQEKKILESVNNKGNNETLKSDNRSMCRKQLNAPSRFSKRLAGLEPELLSHLEEQGKGVSAVIRSVPNCTGVHPQEMHLCDDIKDISAENKGLHDLSGSAMTETTISNKGKGIDENGDAFTPGSDGTHGKNILDNGNNGSKETSKSNNKKRGKQHSAPSRFSKRLAKGEPELLAHLEDGERAVRMRARSGRNEAAPALSTEDKASQQPEANPGAVHLNDTFKGNEILSEEASNKNQKPHNNQAAPHEQPEKLETKNKELLERAEAENNEQSKLESANDDNQDRDSVPYFPFLDSWSDPCLEFAFKTLTGAIPLEDDLAIQGYFQQHFNSSNTQTDTSVLPDFSVASIFQSDFTPQPDSGEKSTAKQKQALPPPSPPVLPAGDVNLPSCSAAAPRQPGLGASKECQINVNY